MSTLDLDTTRIRLTDFTDHVTVRYMLDDRYATSVEADMMTIIADRQDEPEDPAFFLRGFWIARIITPEKYRGQGAASFALDAFLAHMDQKQTVCFLTPNAYGTQMKQARLVEWYIRRGFREDDRFCGLFIRTPKKAKDPFDVDDSQL